MDFNKSLEQFKKLFQGSDTYHGQSKKLGLTEKMNGVVG
jgi:hypothetical protein